MGLKNVVVVIHRAFDRIKAWMHPSPLFHKRHIDIMYIMFYCCGVLVQKS